ncbi:MAG TPA: hypothetical protein VFO62_07495 [Candidatus Binatia bacterium]|nr:hypothetical protein [Candidatus Binatia bacterium]
MKATPKITHYRQSALCFALGLSLLGCPRPSEPKGPEDDPGPAAEPSEQAGSETETGK